MKMLSLCSGIGGIDLAWEWAGGQTVAFSETDPFCSQILDQQWPDVPNLGDIRTITSSTLKAHGIDPTSIDILAGGIPCQPFSIAGQKRGTADDRHLWPEMLRILNDIRPRWVLIENVAHFASMVLDLVLADLEAQDYTCGTVLLPAASVQAPHKRERTFVVAYTNSQRLYHSQATGGNQPNWQTQGWQESPDRAQQSGQALADPTGTGLEGCLPSSLAPREVLDSWRGDPYGWNRLFERRLGRVAHGISSWLDQMRWPSCPHAPQHDWEPPRTQPEKATAEDRKRLKALGNAVVPQHIYPLLALIAILIQQEHALVYKELSL